ncbi:hypothetical protein FLONG3_6859 [Fusarium longipes]|uniref:Uncharacterized protein n=1 Tax=Fusarium longipes TaxID=694270 RepID=A0A395SIB6_9HYPO|nr:hypothetical protein FLONG3_6859 [Fusarium longipes]
MAPLNDIAITVKVPAKLYWKMIDSYDNSHNSNTTYTRSTTIHKSTELRIREFSKTVEESASDKIKKENISANAGLSWKILNINLSAGVDVTTNIRDSLSHINETEFTANYKEERTETTSYNIGPRDSVYLYQRVLSVAGVEILSDSFSTESHKKGKDEDTVDFLIDVDIRAIQYVKDINVAYGDQPSDAPEYRVRAYDNANDDLNSGFRGKYVWLVPVYTYNAKEACTSFDLVIQEDKVMGRDDLAKGAGGKNRYLVPVRDSRVSEKIVDAKLVRRDSSAPAQTLRQMLGQNWEGCDFDINNGRKKDWLYLGWKVMRS